MSDENAPPSPPRWPASLMRAAIPCEPVRSAILGDLHEEFVHESKSLGPRAARSHYGSRAASIVVRALWDSLCWRNWEGPIAEYAIDSSPTAPAPPTAALAPARAIGRGLVVFSLTVSALALGITVSTALFITAQAIGQESPLLFLALEVASLLGFLCSAGAAAGIMCVGPRWRRSATRKS